MALGFMENLNHMADVSARELLLTEIQELSTQVEGLTRKLEGKKRALSALDEIENNLSDGHTKPSSSAIYIKPNEFSNMEIAQAVEKYLHMLEDRFGDVKRIPPQHLYQDVMPALSKGGCVLSKKGDSKRHERNLKIAVRMNSKPSNPLYYDDKTETVALKQWQKASKARTA